MPRLISALCLVMFPLYTSANSVDDTNALYGEIGILQEQLSPEIRTGHDALQPLSDAMSGYFGFKDKLRDKSGVNYTIEYSPQFQWSFDSNNHSNDETNLIVQWSPVDHSTPKRGTLMGWYQISRTLGSWSTSEFMEDIGVISPVNGGDTGEADKSSLWQMLAWEQWFNQNQLRLGLGKLTTRTFLDLNRYAVSDREDFYSPMIVNNPVSPYTARNGMGVYAQYFLGNAYVTGMIREADGTSTGVSFDTIDSGKWERALELGLTPENLANQGKGNYRFTLYHTDSIGSGTNYQPTGWSASLSFDQDFGSRYSGLFRYAYASEDYRAFKQRVAVGFQIKNPLQFKYDRIGVAAWWGDPTNERLSGEYGIEAFWKLQLAPYLELSPDFQYVFNPQADQSRSDTWIAGLRLRIVL